MLPTYDTPWLVEASPALCFHLYAVFSFCIYPLILSLCKDVVTLKINGLSYSGMTSSQIIAFIAIASIST